MGYPSKFDEPGYCVLDEGFWHLPTPDLIEEMVKHMQWVLDNTISPDQLEYGCSLLYDILSERIGGYGVRKMLEVRLGCKLNCKTFESFAP